MLTDGSVLDAGVRKVFQSRLNGELCRIVDAFKFSIPKLSIASCSTSMPACDDESMSAEASVDPSVGHSAAEIIVQHMCARMISC